MMTSEELRALKRRMRYRLDKIDGWRIDKTGGAFVGDCDDFAVTALWLAEGRSMLRFWLALFTLRAVIWYVRDPNGALHLALWHRRHGWTDLWFPEWHARTPHRRLFPGLLHAPVKMAVGWVFRQRAA